jgi:RNA polymerase sigma-70 factor (ECF subfamily)
MIGVIDGEAVIVQRDRVAEATADAQLVARVARGDRAALAELYDGYAPAAYSLAVRLVGEARAEDVVHDAFVALLDRRTTFDPARGAFRAWFLTTIHHRCLNLLRGPPADGIERVAEVLPDPDPAPVDQVVQRLQDAAVRSALAQLPAAQREALVLAYYGGLSQSALAERLGVPLGTMKARMRRGLIALRGLLRGEATPIDEDEAP